MSTETPVAVTETFLDRCSDGEFHSLEELLHSEGEIEWDDDLAFAVSVVLEGFLFPLILAAVPIEVTETTVIERDESAASVHAEVDVVETKRIEADVELRPETVDGDDGAEAWRIWDVDFTL